MKARDTNSSLWSVFVGASASALGRLPPGLSRSFGAALGELAFRLDQRHRRVAVRSIETALPELSTAARLDLARRSFRHFGATTLEFFTLGTLTPRDLCRRLRLTDWHHVARAASAGRGVLIVTGHIGFFELLGTAIALYKGPLHIVARPIDSPALEDAVRRIRERFGNISIPKRGAARGLLKAIAARAYAVILIDQRVHPNEGVEVPFFGQPSWTTPLPAQVSLRTEVPVVPMFVVSEPGGRHRVIARAPIFPRGPALTVEALTTVYLSVIEDEIRARPHQWLWMHDRWRRR